VLDAPIVRCLKLQKANNQLSLTDGTAAAARAGNAAMTHTNAHAARKPDAAPSGGYSQAAVVR